MGFKTRGKSRLKVCDSIKVRCISGLQPERRYTFITQDDVLGYRI
jgi:hypothetical protein